MTPDDVRQQIELKVVELIKNKLADGSMTEERSQQISQIVLDTVKPGMSFDDLYRAIPHLDDNAPELSSILVPILREYEEQINRKAMEKVSTLIREGKYDAATKLATKAIKQDMKLVYKGTAKPGQSGITKPAAAKPVPLSNSEPVQGKDPAPVASQTDSRLPKAKTS